MPITSAQIIPEIDETSSASQSHLQVKNTSVEDTMRLITNIHQVYNEFSSSQEIQSIKEWFSLKNKVLDEKDDLENQYKFIKERIQIQLDKCSAYRQKDWENLHNKEKHLKDLKCEVQSIHQKNMIILDKKKKSNERIKKYELEALEVFEKIDEVEAEKKRSVPRLKQQISLLAAATRIKWDFEHFDLLVGEVDVLSKQVHRKFYIDPSQHSDFDVADKLWTLIDGGSL